ARRGDVAVHASRRPQLEPLARRHVAGHLTFDDDRGARDLRVHQGALADREHVLRGDLAVDLSLDATRALEDELARDLRSLAEERVHPRSAGDLIRASLPLTH